MSDSALIGSTGLALMLLSLFVGPTLCGRRVSRLPANPSSLASIELPGYALGLLPSRWLALTLVPDEPLQASRDGMAGSLNEIKLPRNGLTEFNDSGVHPPHGPVLPLSPTSWRQSRPAFSSYRTYL
jgi:hypothetical protein